MSHNRPRLGRMFFLAAFLAACADPPTVPVPQSITHQSPAKSVTDPAASSVPLTLVVFPDQVELAPGETETFTAYVGPVDASGNPDLGADGIPGTTDDSFTPVDASWSVQGDIGDISTTTGTSTTLAASLPDGSSVEFGGVFASYLGMTAFADVQVVDEGEPIGDKKKKKPKVCVQYTSGGRKVGKEMCREVLSVAVKFDAGKKMTAKFNKQTESTDDRHDGFFVVFNADGTGIRTASWLIRNTEQPITNAALAGAKKIDLEFAEAGGEITGAWFTSFTGEAIPMPSLKRGRKIDDIHIRQKK